MGVYVRNLWYVAAWEDEIEANAYLVRTLLDEQYLIYRRQDGENYVMLADRCPHRFARLSKGKRNGDAAVCPYHGLEFGPTGACVHNPAAEAPPANARVASPPVVGRHGLLWFWPGDPARADAAAIPDFSYLSRQTVKRGRSHFRGHYELLTDNLMDLSHVEYIHRATFHPNGAVFRGDYEVFDGEGHTIHSNWRLPDVNAPPMLDGRVPEGATVDQYLDMRWHAPASMSLDIIWVASGSTRGDALFRIVSPHIITPETTTTSHYFWTCDPTPEAEALAYAVFHDEDRPMIESVQEAIGDSDFWTLNPVILKGDAGAVYARRRLMQMRRDE